MRLVPALVAVLVVGCPKQAADRVETRDAVPPATELLEECRPHWDRQAAALDIIEAATSADLIDQEEE